jgi:hypothetical protein
MNDPREFPIDQVWDYVRNLLQDDLGDSVSVDTIGAEDFDEDGMLTVVPPAARLLFLDEVPSDITDSTALNYNTDQHFAVMCADEDRSADPQEQRNKSLRLAGKVKHCLVGARVRMANGQMSSPIVFAGTRPYPTQSVGMAYVVALTISGIASFEGPNAYPQIPQGAQNA